MSVNVLKDANFKQNIIDYNIQNTESRDQHSNGESLMDTLCFKYALCLSVSKYILGSYKKTS